MPGLHSLDIDDSVEPPDPAVSFGPDDLLVVDDGVDEEEFVERDPTGRYARYREVLGKGAMKTVYRGYDRVDCKEVAWNQAKPIDCGGASVQREVQILRSLNHKGIIKLYSDWVDMETGNTNFITELCSATLLGYRMKHKHASRKAVKTWGRQILSEIAHLHAHNPPIIHRDLKCENIFVKCSAKCTLKLGDFGSATLLDETKHLHTLVGTPEFMAPEMYQEDYNQLVDVYSFGMCMLELLTRECPYSECKSVAEIYKKVTSGVKPESLGKVKDLQALRLINRCLLPVSQRPSAMDLLSDPFLQCDEIAQMESSSITGVESKSNSLSDITSQAPTSDLLEMILASEGTAKCLDPVATRQALNVPRPTDLAVNCCKSNVVPGPYRLQRHFQVTGYVEDETTIRLQLRIQQSGRVRDIMFPFDTIHDSPASVAEELVGTLEYPESDTLIIADLMAAEIQSIVCASTEKSKAIRGDGEMMGAEIGSGEDDHVDTTIRSDDESSILHRVNNDARLHVGTAHVNNSQYQMLGSMHFNPTPLVWPSADYGAFLNITSPVWAISV